ncbi:unnamed protein product [Lepeophtheirus salmonis]|uniref:(salmon louse) hypothetical protein n=1 Tax=Lepeophtheirus salmonis TaxID=72036 RepID=A0A7R8CQ20_LEPSM|nr:unnamed protein product [Lepeophtheirus salmonis]CAF2888707.1 unnamed protein product [Lepeophtheirus salmonis]
MKFIVSILVIVLFIYQVKGHFDDDEDHEIERKDLPSLDMDITKDTGGGHGGGYGHHKGHGGGHGHKGHGGGHGGGYGHKGGGHGGGYGHGHGGGYGHH